MDAVTVITPRTGGGRLADLWRSRGVLGSLVLREIAVRYRHAALGVAWALLQPLALMALATLVFHRVLALPGEGAPYPVFVFAGLVPWTFFHAALTAAVPSLVNDASLVKKIYFPRETIPLASVCAVGLDLAAGLSVLLVLAPPSGAAALLLLVPPLLVLGATAVACGLLGAALNVHWRDVKHALPLLLQLWFFATPVVYPLSRVPAGLQPLFWANPLTYVVEGVRAALLTGRTPSPTACWPGLLVTAALLAIAGIVFRRASARFADVL